jgi:hypothetical protein
MGLGFVFQLTGVILLAAVVVLLKIRTPAHAEFSTLAEAPTRI